ncbi:MAG: neutral/alkaline non-lysosomal ceramidase N-terminal domain-containing protein [Archangium sp.]
MSSRLLFLSCLIFCACPKPVEPPPPEPGPLQAATATRRLDIPIGITMGGYSRSRPSDEPGSPWAKQMPSSRGLHTEPTVRVIAMSNGLERVAFIRMDTTLISSTMRARTQAALTAAGETAHVFMHATHSHSSPARIMPPARLGGPTGTDFVSLVMDHYDAEVEDRMTQAIVAATVEAFANLKRVSVGVSSVEAGDFNNDRRCENDPVYGANFRDTKFTVLRIDEVDDNGAPIKPMTAMLHYPMHGTVLGSENTLISTEITGAVELYSGDLLGVPVMFVQGAAGDVSPKGSPFGHDAMQNLERQGRAAAVLVKQAFDAAAPGNAKEKSRLDFRERGVTLSREAMGYAEGEFPEFGGIQCAAGGDSPVCGSIKSTPAQVSCLPLEPRRPPFKTAMTLIQLDDVAFVSTPGELGTGLSRKLISTMAPLGASTVFAVGYAQDHYGYLLEEDDWLRGGYEPTVSAWGWKFGPYLLNELEQFVATVDQQQPSADVAALPEVTLRERTNSTGPAKILTEPLDGQRLTTHLFEFEGGDPGLGTPQVSLEVEEGGSFVPVQASATRVVVNGPELILRYSATPTFRSQPMATARTYVWSVQFETLPTTPLATYRLVAKGRIKNGSESDYSLISRGFVVSASDAASTATARFTTDARLALDVRFPPNPTEVASNRDDPVKNFRVRDADSDPRDGARLKGGSVMATVNGTATTFTWSDSERAYVSEPQTSTGLFTVEVAANGVTDGSGNHNGLALTATATR